LTPFGKSEKIKLYIVIGLLFVAVIVAYFRFIHKKNDTGVDIARPAPQKMVFELPQTIKIKPERRPQPSGSSADEALGMTIRDIFAPLQMPTEPKPVIQAEKKPEPMGVLTLKGTIIGGQKAMAVINDKFIRIGEKIGEYQIVKIASNEVVLRSGSHEKVLHVLTIAGEK
jgi:hypothetical protein